MQAPEATQPKWREAERPKLRYTLRGILLDNGNEIVPTPEHVLVEQVEIGAATPSGIVLADITTDPRTGKQLVSAKDSNPVQQGGGHQCEVISLGSPDYAEGDQRIAVDLKRGDRLVMRAGYGGRGQPHWPKGVIIVLMRDILCVERKPGPEPS